MSARAIFAGLGIPSHPGLIKPRLAPVRATPGPRYQWTRNMISPSSPREAPAPTILEASGKATTSGRIQWLHYAPAQANSCGGSRLCITIYGITTWRRSRRCLHGKTRSEEHTSELQSQSNLVCRLLLENKKNEG